MGSPATVVAAAAAKDADTVREYLTRNPQDVRQSKIMMQDLIHNVKRLIPLPEIAQK
jgi:hypothetical protein